MGGLGLISGSRRSPGEGNGNHSSVLAWRIPWTEDPDRLQSMGLQRVGHNWAFTLKILPAVTKVSVIVKCYWHSYCHSEKRFLTKVSYRRKRAKLGKACKKCKWILRTTGNNQRFEMGEDHHCLIGEGNGNPLQCSCLENPRDGGACWAAIYGVTQSRTRLKRLSSSSNSITVLKKKNCHWKEAPLLTFSWDNLPTMFSIYTYFI